MTKKDIFSEYSPDKKHETNDKRDLSFEQRAVSKNASLNTKQIKIS